MAEAFRIDLQGHDALLARLGELAGALEDIDPLLNTIGAVLESAVEERFDAKRDPAGGAWAALAPSTAAAYARQDAGRGRGTLLERTGLMRDSLGYNVVAGALVEVGFGRAYAQYHETGTRRMPRRGLLLASVDAAGGSGTLGREDEDAILDAIESHIGGALGV
jgi:phage virion morphogenesis protein